MRQWASRVQGMPDEVTALSLDNAVMTFGIWAENQLNERYPDGRPVTTLKKILGIEESPNEKAKANMQQFAALRALLS